MILNKINKANDIKNLGQSELMQLTCEIRTFLIENISYTGGHLASNLGVVELTMALHLALDLPQDKLIWDVGHQAYTHKILTGRKNSFDALRKFGGISGFPKRSESPSDAFDTGHSSTSISAGLGYASAREIRGEDYRVVSVIGDGSITGGMAYEALNNAAQLKSNFVIVLNDNNMSISENIGGISGYLDGLRTAKGYMGLKENVQSMLKKFPHQGERLTRYITNTKSGIKQLFVPGMLFENMGITYLGPIDGHDLQALQRAFHQAMQVKKAVLVHVITNKGQGYRYAEENPARFHGTAPFNIATGCTLESDGIDSYTDVFSKVICDEGGKNENIVAITAAMGDGTGLAAFSKRFPKRFFDVGIAEEHAVTFAAGLAAGGMKPVVAIYSSFLQRAYDQIIHDVCLQNLPVFFAIDRAGLVGSDGETHQGLFDLSYLSSIPHMVIMAPKNRWEMADMIRFALDFPTPIALRYPRGEAYRGLVQFRSEIKLGKSEILYEEDSIAIIFIGNMANLAESVRYALKEIGYNCSLVNGRFVKPLDTERIEQLAKTHQLFVTLEENELMGGFGQQVAAYVQEAKLEVRVRSVGISDEYVEHGNVDLLRKEVGLDKNVIVNQVVSDYIIMTGEAP
ncbi:MAG: 1-deoxy-D-xylulose-5-phosphate synthase [Lachnospiraceae bacterium]|nr:1-deoxy-D-xylulose-5-phosphate synthase [Lachnospiraceae bacterium]